MAFLLADIKCVARSHLLSGIWERSYSVPIVAVNGFWHGRHLYRPGRVLLPLSSVASLTVPQWGQIGPSGQRSFSKWARAASSSVKILFVRSQVMAKLSFWPKTTTLATVCQVHNSPN